MLLLATLAAAEPLLGGLDLSSPGQLRAEPGVEVFPVLAIGGMFISELFVGVGMPSGFDVRAGAGMYAMLYSTDDGYVVDEPFMPPVLGFVDVVARFTVQPSVIFPEDRLSIGLRLDNRPWKARYFGADEWGVGPELAMSHRAGPLWLHFRPNYLVQPYWLPDAFGQLNVGTSLSVPAGVAEPFVDVEPSMWLGLGHAGNSGPASCRMSDWWCAQGPSYGLVSSTAHLFPERGAPSIDWTTRISPCFWGISSLRPPDRCRGSCRSERLPRRSRQVEDRGGVQANPKEKQSERHEPRGQTPGGAAPVPVRQEPQHPQPAKNQCGPRRRREKKDQTHQPPLGVGGRLPHGLMGRTHGHEACVRDDG